MRTQLATFFSRLAYALDPNLDIFESVIVAAEKKAFAKMSANAAILVDTLSSFEDQDVVRGDLARRLTSDEVSLIVTRAKQTYDEEHPNDIKFDDLPPKVKAIYIDGTIQVYLNEKIEQKIS